MTKPSAKVPVGSIHSETEQLLCCARTCMDPETASRVCILLREEIDWAYLLQKAHQHRMIPLLYWSLKATCPEAVPKTILEQLQGYFHANARRNLLLTGELIKLLSLLEAQGIAAIPLKGPVLAASVYGNLAFRQFSDLDLLVRKQDVLRSKDLLLSQGYRLWMQMTSAQEMDYLQSEHAYQFVSDDDRTVELHWEIMPGYFAFPLDIEPLWERLEPVSLAGTTVKNLPPEDLLLFLCVHGAKHSWGRLDLICDVAELVRRYPGMKWEQVIERGHALHSQRRLFLGLLLAKELLLTTLPEEVSQRLETDPAIKPLAAAVREQLFRGDDTLPTSLQRDRFQFRVMERRQDRVRYVWHRLWTPNDRDWTFLPLPASLSFLYALLRPIRLVREHGPSLLKHLFKHLKRQPNMGSY